MSVTNSTSVITSRWNEAELKEKCIGPGRRLASVAMSSVSGERHVRPEWRAAVRRHCQHAVISMVIRAGDY